jgi:hypothetical protein
MLGYNSFKLFEGFVWFHFIVFKNQVVIFNFDFPIQNILVLKISYFIIDFFTK